jgi:uncharacterized protein YabE (DUF348 family)
MVEKTKNYLKYYFSNGSKLIFIVLLSFICVTVLLINARKTVTVSVNGTEQSFVTYKSVLSVILKNKGIEVGPFDKTTPGLDSKVKNGDKIYIKTAVNVEMNVDNKIISVKSAENNVGKVLKDNGIILEDLDKVSPSVDTALSNGLKVVVTRVKSELLKEVQPIDFSTVVKNDDNSEKNVTTVQQEGQLGEKEITTRVVYENGKVVTKDVISEVVTQAPVNKIVAVGTLGVVPISRGGKVYFTNSVRMRATAYSSDYESTNKNPGDPGYGITYSGAAAKRDTDGYSSVAVDPRVIPLGTKLFIQGYGYAIAQDIGSAIKGNRVDLYFNSSSDVWNWGSRTVTVYILK